MSQVEPHHVIEALKPIWNTRPETARRVRQRIRTILEWGIAKGYRTTNAAGPAIHGVLPKKRPADKNKQHYAAVPYSELPQVVAEVRRMNAAAPLRLLFEFLVLTVVRSAEACEAQWSEIDFDEATWMIPDERMKMNFPHRVPLSDRALEILRAMHAQHMHSGTGFVFPGKKPGRPFSGSAVLTLLGRLNLPATVHGLRSSSNDWVAETGAATQDVADRALAHARKNQTRAAYLRTDFLEARRPLMQRWADYVAAKGVAASGG